MELGFITSNKTERGCEQAITKSDENIIPRWNNITVKITFIRLNNKICIVLTDTKDTFLKHSVLKQTLSIIVYF